MEKQQADLPDEVMNRAVEEAGWRVNSGVHAGMPIYNAILAHVRAEVKRAVREQAPILIEAERERIKARIEKYAEMEEEIAEDYTSPDYGRGIVAGYRAALSVIDEGKEA